MEELTDLERQVLDMEGRFWRYAGAKETAIRTTFGLSPWRYQQLVFEVCRKPAALAAAPGLVNRINRRRR